LASKLVRVSEPGLHRHAVAVGSGTWCGPPPSCIGVVVVDVEQGAVDTRGAEPQRKDAKGGGAGEQQAPHKWVSAAGVVRAGVVGQVAFVGTVV